MEEEHTVRRENSCFYAARYVCGVACVGPYKNMLNVSGIIACTVAGTTQIFHKVFHKAR